MEVADSQPALEAAQRSRENGCHVINAIVSRNRAVTASVLQLYGPSWTDRKISSRVSDVGAIPPHMNASDSGILLLQC